MTLSKAEGEMHGFAVQVYDTQPDAIQAVVSGRAYATLGGNTVIAYAASNNPQRRAWPLVRLLSRLENRALAGRR